MADLSLRERLQPSLLDRLLDDERLLTLFELTTPATELQRLQIGANDFAQILQAQGLRPMDPEHPGPLQAPDGTLTWSCVAPAGASASAS